MTGNEVEKVQESRNQLVNLEGPITGANGSGMMTNTMEPHNGRYPLIKFHGKKHGQVIYIWSDGTRYEGKYRDNKKHGGDIETLSNGSRHEVEYCDGVKSAKETPCSLHF